MTDIKLLKEEIGLKPTTEIIEILKGYKLSEIEEHILLLILEDFETTLNYLKSIEINRDFIKRLSESEFYLHRLMAAKTTKDKDILLELTNDSIGVVAKAALMNLECDDYEAEEIVTRILKDGSVYLQSGVIPLIIKIKDHDIVIRLAKIIKTKVWRVRLALVSNICQFDRSLKLYEMFLDDPDEKVRSTLASQDPEIGMLLLRDQSENVRFKCLQQLTNFSKNLEIDKSQPSNSSESKNSSNKAFNMISEYEIQRILDDKSEKVRLEALKLNNKSLSLKIIPEFIKSTKWRVRKEVCEGIYNLRFIGSEEFTNELLPYLKIFFKDPVSELRKYAAEVFLQLASEFGEDWVSQQKEFFNDLIESSNYLIRQNLAKIAIELKMSDLLLKLLKDKVSNVVISTLNSIQTIWDDDIYQVICDLTVSNSQEIRDIANNIINRTE